MFEIVASLLVSVLAMAGAAGHPGRDHDEDDWPIAETRTFEESFELAAGQTPRVVVDDVARQDGVALHRLARHRLEWAGAGHRLEGSPILIAQADHPRLGEQPGDQVPADEQRRVAEHLASVGLREPGCGLVEPGDEFGCCLLELGHRQIPSMRRGASRGP